jgi:pimeloyl-ACP methyl ester carboxylesterase
LKALRLLDRLFGPIFPGITGLYAAKIFVKPRDGKSRNMGGWNLLVPGGTYVAWGKNAKTSDTPRTVLLIHGWESHAGHMSVLADALNVSGFNVVALDAPAHGDAEGSATNAIQFAAALLAASQKLGPFYAVVGHSMGGGAAFIALADGLPVKKVVTIASPFLFSEVLHRFAQHIGLPPKAEKSFVDRVERLTGRSWDETRGDVVTRKVTQPVLVVHDVEDKEIPLTDALDLMRVLQHGHLMQTTGLGHRRILRDRDTALAIAQWISE